MVVCMCLSAWLGEGIPGATVRMCVRWLLAALGLLLTGSCVAPPCRMCVSSFVRATGGCWLSPSAAPDSSGGQGTTGAQLGVQRSLTRCVCVCCDVAGWGPGSRTPPWDAGYT